MINRLHTPAVHLYTSIGKVHLTVINGANQSQSYLPVDSRSLQLSWQNFDRRSATTCQSFDLNSNSFLSATRRTSESTLKNTFSSSSSVHWTAERNVKVPGRSTTSGTLFHFLSSAPMNIYLWLYTCIMDCSFKYLPWYVLNCLKP